MISRALSTLAAIAVRTVPFVLSDSEVNFLDKIEDATFHPFLSCILVRNILHYNKLNFITPVTMKTIIIYVDCRRGAKVGIELKNKISK